MATDPQPLAAMLASHPEECAAVVAVLSSYDSANALVIADALRIDRIPLPAERVAEIVDALMHADLCIRGSEGRHWIYAMSHGERRAIARMGAAAWLAARLPRTDSHRFFDLSNARLHEIASGAMRSAVSEEDRKAAYRVRAQCDSAVPQSAETYRYVLTSIVARGVPLDVDAEVAAVWGAAPVETAK